MLPDPYLFICIATLFPEQIQRKQTFQVHKIRWWAQLVGTSVTKSELEKVDQHECEEADSRNCQIELALADLVVDRNVPRSLEGHKHVEKGTQSNINLHNVCWQTKSSWIQTNIEVSIPIEIIGAQEN